MMSPDPSESTILSFPAASSWRATHVAWLPPGSRPSPSELHDAALTGLSSIEPGELRERAIASFHRGALDISPPYRHASLQWSTLIDLKGQVHAAGLAAWSVVEVSVAGTLDERMVPLWVSLAAARGIARSLDSITCDGFRTRLHSRASVALPVAAEPAFVLADHVMLVSSSDHRDRGLMTTLGMHGIGVPELRLADVPARALPGLGVFMNGLAWKILRLAISTPPSASNRDVRRQDEIEIHRAHVDAALGRARGAVLGGAEARGRVRLRLDRDATGAPWLALDPPRSFGGTRAQWALRLSEALRRSGEGATRH